MGELINLDEIRVIRSRRAQVLGGRGDLDKIVDPDAILEVFKLGSCLSLRAARDRAEIAVVSAALDSTGRNMSRASEMLGVSRPTLYDLMKKHGLSDTQQAR